MKISGKKIMAFFLIKKVMNEMSKAQIKVLSEKTEVCEKADIPD